MDEVSRTLRKKEKTRHTLILAAQDLVLERRGGKISIQEITEKADLGLGTFYNYFDSKQEIYQAVVELMREDFMSGLNHLRSNMKDPVTLVAHTIRYCVRENLLNEEWRDFLKYSGLEGNHFLEQTPGQCAEDLLRGIKAGRFKIHNVEFATNLIQGMLRQVAGEMLQGTMGTEGIDELASSVLRMLGLPDVVARAIVQAPLPPVRANKVQNRGVQPAPMDANSSSPIALS